MADTTANADAPKGTPDDVTIDPNLADKDKVAALEDQNRKLFERAKKAEGFIKNDEGHWIKKPEASPITKTVETVVPKASEILKADEFKLYRAGYTESEIDLIMHNGGAKILEDKKSPLVLGLIAAKDQRKAEDAASAVVDSTGASDIERKYSEAEMRAMKTEDLEKLIPHVQK